MLQKYSAPYASDFDVCAKRVKFVSETDKSVFETDIKKKRKVFILPCAFLGVPFILINSGLKGNI